MAWSAMPSRTRRWICRRTAAGSALLVLGLATLVTPQAAGGAAASASSTATVRSPGVTAVMDAGGVTALRAGGLRIPVRAETLIEGLPDADRKTLRRAGGGVVVVERTVSSATHRARIVERFSAGRSSIRWDVEIAGEGAPWSTPIRTVVRYPATSGTRFWTAWSDPVAPERGREDQPAGWNDPLRPAAPADRRLWYGAPDFSYDNPRIGFCPLYGDLLSIPLASYLEPSRDVGVSLVLDPGGEWFDLTLETRRDGQAAFSRNHHRLGGGLVVRFGMDLVAHEADWRGGLRWMASRYPAWFGPALPAAHELSGTGAYSATEVAFDAAKMKRMAFRTNWKASFDFPYMGMFLPPLEDGSWPRFSQGMTSLRQMADYSTRMRAAGFQVLNYFNVTEFGAHVQDPQPAATAPQNPAELWKNGDAFLYGRLASAILRVPAVMRPESLKFYGKTKPGGPYYTWEDGVVMDAGEPAYKQFLLDQARRHVSKLPDSAGVCIDRLDWLRMYNEERDDGVSWFGGKPARSLYSSWRGLMAELAPVFHKAGKVVFVNNHLKRIDLLRDVDGIFDEFTYNGAALNTTALLTVNRPALGWTGAEAQIRPDPDGFFQRFLYLGVFPMAPFPGNDHSLAPSEWVDRQYLDYGPLMQAMQGRVWVLEPHAIAVREGKAVANLFAAPDGGWVAPVMLGGGETQAKVEIRGLRTGTPAAEALHPGVPNAVPLRPVRERRAWVLTVPLVRGCAMVRIRAR